MRRFPPLLLLLACEPPPEPEPPFACAPAPELTVFVGEWAQGDLCFEDPEGAELAIHLALTNDRPLAQVQVWDAEEIRVLGRWPDTTTVIVTAIDPDSLKATLNVPVLVPNRAPAGSLDDVDVHARFGATINLSDHFSDPDGQPLFYSASSSDPSVVDVAALSDSLLRIENSGGQGSAEISVTASDGEESVTAAFEATVVPSELVLSDDFDSDESLDDWALGRKARAEIEDGYFVLTADSTDYYGQAWQGFHGTASEWIVDITLRTTDADAQAGFVVSTGVRPIWSYQFLLGEANIAEIGDVNWLFGWWHVNRGWVTRSWAYGTSSHIRDFTDVEVSLSMTETGVRATVDGKLLFEQSSVDHLPRRGVGLTLVTRPEHEGGVASSMNRVQVITPELTVDSLLHAHLRPDIAPGHPTRRWNALPTNRTSRRDRSIGRPGAE
ncbi:MAG: hypothetical protein OXQ94_16235 [Gemmatimonadota bacterium]|nr:hypothetical protein [Gemmatimonadota bacterium]MDE2873228.1 hypothetical protein [Gemmatimonadota bacterium]